MLSKGLLRVAAAPMVKPLREKEIFSTAKPLREKEIFSAAKPLREKADIQHHSR